MALAFVFPPPSSLCPPPAPPQSILRTPLPSRIVRAQPGAAYNTRRCECWVQVSPPGALGNTAYVRLRILTHLTPPVSRVRTPLTRALGLDQHGRSFLRAVCCVCDVIFGLDRMPLGTFVGLCAPESPSVPSLAATLPSPRHTPSRRPHPYRRPLAKSVSGSSARLPSSPVHSRTTPTPMSNSRTRSRSNSGSNASTASPRVRLRRSRSRDRSPSIFSTRGEPFQQQQAGTETRSEYASASASGSRSPQPGNQSRTQQDSSSATWTSPAPDTSVSAPAYPPPRKQNVACDACRSRKVKCVRNPGMDKVSCFAGLYSGRRLVLVVLIPQTRGRIFSSCSRGSFFLRLWRLVYWLHVLLSDGTIATANLLTSCLGLS